VVANLLANAGRSQEILRRAIPRIARAERQCACGSALATALITHPEAIPPIRQEQLGLLLGKYLG